MNAEQLKERTMQYAMRVIGLVRVLPRDAVCQTVGRQIVRSATGVAANYRAGCRARSRSEFVAKMGIVEEEADETLFWLELLARTGLVEPQSLTGLLKEGNEIVAIAVSSKRTARARLVGERAARAFGTSPSPPARET